jgi:hypothetical protein
METSFSEDLLLQCDCGCSMLNISQFEYGGDVTISHYTSSFYSNQETLLDKFKDRIKLIWYIIIGKKYCFFDVIISDKADIEKFKNMVKNIDISKVM